ncbi:SIR2 family protein [uncultured Propionibacterium sp.]|uniref:SIR2 family protein n=1 Tax=uncultured Propionibacterium sp. TaxID=218066 RepID=UPI00292D13CF|nr:SIR2 family protein [uncultured Propionibacterium sp.]
MTNDVIIPQELIDAHHDGNLVVFVGAGASIKAPSSLPSFKSLTKTLAEMARVPFLVEDGIDKDGAVRWVEPQELDRFLGRMPKDFALHRHAMELVSPEGSFPNSTHGAVIHLADSGGGLRIVTTNYDDHLADAAGEAGIDIRGRWNAPLLPQGDDFEGLVHLHGSIKGDSRGVVLTDKDFGEAYLSNGWATRFLVPMFRRYVVLFIGYSYGDLIMRYLTRGLSSGVRCYVMMDSSKADADDWRSLGVTPIGYSVSGNDHGALVDALRGWDELARMRHPEHRDRMTKIVKSGKDVLAAVDRDYLLGQLATVRGVENFEASCRLLSAPAEKNSWLRWIETEVPDFSRAFRGETVGEATKKLLQWFAETFIADPKLHGAALQAVRRLGQRFNDDLLSLARLAAVDLGVKDEVAGNRWKMFLLTSVGRPVMAPYRGPLPHEPGASGEHMAVLTEALRPHLILSSHSDYSDENLAFPHCEPKWEIDGPSLSSHLKMVVEQAEPGNLELGLMLEKALLSVYHLTDAYHDSKVYRMFDELIQFVDMSDEPYCHRTPVNSLVDALRDYGVKAMTSGENLVQRWWSFDWPLFQRLAVHLVTESGMNADDKITWVLDHDALYLYVLKPEVLRLLIDSVAQATSQVKDKLLARIMSGSYPHGEQNTDYSNELADYDHYTILSLLHRKDPQWDEVDEILRSLELQYPKLEPPDYQDLVQRVKGGGAGGKAPMPMKDFLRLLHENPGGVMKDLLGREYSPWGTSESTWCDARAMVTRACEGQAGAGRLIIQGMEEQAEGHEDRVKDLRRAVVESWGKADLSGVEEPVIRTVGELVDSSDESDLNAVGDFLVEQIKIQKDSIESSLIVSMRGFAKDLWSRHATSFKHEENVSLAGVSPLYCWPGSVARYWVMESCRRRRAPSEKQCLNEEEKTALTGLLRAPARALDATLPALANHLAFLFDVDPGFVQDELIPFFDTSTLAWSAYLCNPFWTSGLLNSGLLQSMINFWPRIDDLEGSIKEKFIALTLDALSSTDTCSDERAGLLDRTVLVKDGAFAVPFARSVMIFLDLDRVDETEVWRTWLKDHVARRLDGLPREAKKDELECWADVVPFVGDAVPEAVTMMQGHEIPLSEQQFWRSSFPGKVFADFSEWLVAFYTERVSATVVPVQGGFPIRPFGKLVKSLRKHLGDEGVRPLVEAAQKAGIWYPQDQ